MSEKKYLSIRQTAQLGILPEYRLRVLARQGKLPGFYAGVKFMVNIAQLVQMLDTESLRAAGENSPEPVSLSGR